MSNLENKLTKDDFHLKIKHITTLFQFIKTNKDEQFLEYISAITPEEINVNIKDENGNYLISFAIMMNNRKIVKKIIEYGARLDILDAEGYSILYYPIKFNYLEMIDILLESNKKIIGISLVNIKDTRGSVPLFYAVKYRNQYALQELLVYGADANYKNSENMNALIMAVLKKDVTMVRMLTKYTKNLNTMTNLGSTALHNACNFQLTEIVRILIEHGANQNIAETEYDFYPIFYAVVQNNVEITKLLIDYGANPNHQDYLGNTIIHYTIIDHHLEILDYIMENYIIKSKNVTIYIEDINNKEDTSGDHIDPNIVNVEGLTITHLMLYDYREDYDRYLTKIIPFSHLNYQDNNGNTILHIIAEKNLWEKFESLLNMKRLNIYIKNNKGQTIMDMIQLRERDNFLNIVTKSFYNYLKRYETAWLLEWQNQCSLEKTTEISEEKCYQYIRESILKEKISVPSKKNKLNISIVPGELVQFSTFTGSMLDMLVGFKYLTKKYPIATTLYHSKLEHSEELEKYNQTLGIQENPNQHLIHFEIKWIYQKIFFPPNFETIMANIIESKRYQYIIIPIGIILSNGSHSNSLFYDIKEQKMERFEPHGSGYPVQFNYNPDLLDEILYKKITNVLSNIYQKGIKIRYHAPKHYLPKIGFQTLEANEITINKNIGDPNGFCTLWTIWFLDYRLKHINQNPGNLVRKLINGIKINNYSFRTIIRNYSLVITNLRDTYLQKINRNINDYLNNRLSQKELRTLLIEILSDV